MTKPALIAALFAVTLTAVAQQGTPPDPRAGQTSAPAGSPTDTPQAQQNQSPAANNSQTPQDDAATQPAEAKTPPPETSSTPTQPGSTNASKAGEKPGNDAPETAARVDLAPPVTGSPETKIIDPSAVGKHTGVTGALDPLLDTPPPPKGKPTLIGGAAVKVDRIRSRVTVEPFGAKNKMTVYVDERSHIYRNGVETTIMGIKKGDRVYFDTVLDGARVFAKNVRVFSETGAAEVRGQITAYDPARGTIQLQDALSARPVSFRVTSATQVNRQQGKGSIQDLAKGALVNVIFAPDKANRGIATEITILARPGATYTFAGRITNVNIRDGVVSVENRVDGKVYDIAFDPRSRTDRAGLRVGNTVSIAATFDGENYKATNVTVTEAQSTPQSRPDQTKPRPDEQ